MQLRTAKKEEFTVIRDFYWELIDLMSDQSDTVGWKKGIYPTDQFIRESLEKDDLLVLEQNGKLAAVVIINSDWNEGYEGLPWSIDCGHEDVLVPHALAVHPKLQKKGIGKMVMKDVIAIAKIRGKKTVRLDILKGNTAAEKLYPQMGFRYVDTKVMFYEDTGWTEFMMYELLL